MLPLHGWWELRRNSFGVKKEENWSFDKNAFSLWASLLASSLLHILLATQGILMKYCSFAFVLFHRSHLLRPIPEMYHSSFLPLCEKGALLPSKAVFWRTLGLSWGMVLHAQIQESFPEANLSLLLRKYQGNHFQNTVQFSNSSSSSNSGWGGGETGLFRGYQGPASWPHSSLACPLVLGPERTSGIQRLQIFHKVQGSVQNEQGLKGGSVLDLLLLDQGQSRVFSTYFGAMTTCLSGKGHGHFWISTTNLDLGNIPVLRPDNSSAAQIEPLLRKIFLIKVDRAWWSVWADSFLDRFLPLIGIWDPVGPIDLEFQVRGPEKSGIAPSSPRLVDSEEVPSETLCFLLWRKGMVPLEERSI